MVNRRFAALRLLLVVCVLAVAMPAAAQTDEGPATPEPAHVAYIDGVVDITHDGRTEPATVNLPLVSGDQVRTRNGRTEVLFGDGSALDIDHFTTLDFLSDELVRLTEGRIRLTVGGRDQVAYRIDTPSGAVRIEAPGEYRVALVGESGRADVELVTVRGYASLVNEFGETTVRAGERAFATASMAPSYAQAYNSASWDAFDRWAADRRDERTGNVSVEYLPDDVRLYASDFDRHGSWRHDVSYGYVWYPRVHEDWRPYYYGRWNYYRPWGWTWIAYDRWGWATHHYGRWGFRAGAWFWIPSRRWAPAYVYWAGANDYIGWCPLGWDNRPIFNVINVNIGIGRSYRGYDPYRAWTVVPRRVFGPRFDVRRHAVARAEIERAVPRWYVSGMSAPVRAALPGRDTTPIYTAGRAGARRALTTDAPGEPLGRGSIRTAPRASVAPLDERRARTSRAVPRATAPAASGTLGDSRSWQRRGQEWQGGADAPRTAAPRARYRDLGPGGQDVRSQDSESRYGRPRAGGRLPGAAYDATAESNRNPGVGSSRSSSGERARARRDPGSWRSGAAPDGVPSGGIYGSRGVPDDRGGSVYAPRGVPRADVPRGEIPRGDAPGRYPSRIERSSPRDGGGPGPVYAPPVRGRSQGGSEGPRRSVDRPSFGPAPSAPPAGRSTPSADRPRGDGGRERAAPRGGSAPSRPAGGHSRPRSR